MSREKCGKTLDKALPTCTETGFQFFRVVFLELRTARMSDRSSDNKAIKPTAVFSTYPKVAERHLAYAF
jgi:hypothetical protein